MADGPLGFLSHRGAVKIAPCRIAEIHGKRPQKLGATDEPLASGVVLQDVFHNSPPSFLGPNVGIPGAGLLMQPLHLLERDVLVEAGINRLVGGGQVIEELGLFIVVQVVLTNVLI
jgi:hypothetical protein